MYKYYKLSNRFGVNIRQFAKNPLKYFLKSKPDSKMLRQSGVNPMLFDLGLKKKYLRDANRIKRKIREIENNFKLVLIVEYFDESLIVLKDMMCWDFMDIAYFTVNARTEDEIEELSQESKDNLTAWNEGDMLLYNHFNKSLWKKIEEFGFERMKSELEIFHLLIDRLKEICLNGDKHIHGGKTKILKYEAKRMPSSEDNYLCKSLTRKPQEYLEVLRKKMKRMYRI
ncbi:Galactosylceramide sulfotransferase [Holothuria leucospilota]|uniref:Galactosylceramide sulfotransferase n=1 Tax=Holothuria leucospilota TaxID=206669 RepID=A0A9Q0YE16_HOLLE|nr:Galactosylceramide sulfotransferase [Holothuria leucospilota]